MEERAIAVRETVDARKTKIGPDELGPLFEGAKEVLVAKGKKVLRLDPEADAEELAGVALGRSGNLRAPTARVGKRYLVGFHDEAWSELLK